MHTRFSTDTLIETSPLFGGVALKSRASVREALDVDLWRAKMPSGHALPAAPGRPAYYYGSADFMPFREGAREGFQLLEINGTGLGGLTNLPDVVLEEMLSEVSRVADALDVDAPLLVVPLCREQLRGLIHERVLVAQALKEGLRRRYGAGRIALLREAQPASTPGPVVFMGYPPDMRAGLHPLGSRLALGGRVVDAAVRDLFCQRVHDRFAGALAPDAFYPVNEIFRVGASKAQTYALYNTYLAANPSALLWKPVTHWSADNREALVAVTLRALAGGTPVVIKPHASGAGRGIEFLHPSDTERQVIARIDASIAEAQLTSVGESSRVAFPYVVSETLEGQVLRAAGHPLHGHRFELRIVVYRVGDALRAFPSVCKVSGARYDADAPTREMLINTVSSADGASAERGVLLPLCNVDTLEMLGVSVEELAELCTHAMRFVAYVIAHAAASPRP